MRVASLTKIPVPGAVPLLGALGLLASLSAAGAQQAAAPAAAPAAAASPAATAAAPPADPAMIAHQRTLVALAVERYIRPAYASVADAANSLRTATVRYCAQPSPVNTDALRGAFGDMLSAWGRVDFLRFGPATVDHRLERVSFWPDPRNFVEKQLRQLLNGDQLAGIDLPRLKGQSAAVQGLPAFERLLLTAPKEGGVVPDVKAPDFANRCQLATLIATNVTDISAALRDDWARPDGYARLLLKPGPDNPVYRSEAQAADEILKALITGIEQVRDLALGPALGTSPDTAKPMRFPFVRSGNTLVLVRANIAGLAQLIEASGIADGLPPAQSWLRASLLFELGNINRVLGTISDPPATMAGDARDRAKITYARISLASVRDTLVGPLASAVGLNVGFNALDGD
ncbi:imelysin family protein [Pseudoxanthobacter sp.]|uniref:imelysin family protein n=1 Tax=Pseudoxanthobacter sp. TaxID=1925742 RepID=UPI002FE3B80E